MKKSGGLVLLLLLIISSGCVHHSSRREYLGKNPHDPELQTVAQKNKYRIDPIFGSIFEILTSDCESPCVNRWQMSVQLVCAESPESFIQRPLRYKNVKVEVIGENAVPGFPVNQQTDNEGVISMKFKNQEIPKNISFQFSVKDFTKVIADKNLGQPVIFDARACL